MTIQLLHGDCRDVLKTLADASVHACITSPPYYALRSYLHADHPDKHREIGSEPTPADYIATMVEVFREIKRILRDDGCVFCNLGDAYSNKQLQEMPSRVVLALQADGWILRSRMPWLKRSAMPESCNDRPTSAVEYVFLLTKSARYFWDAEAVKRGWVDGGERDRRGYNGRMFARTREATPGDSRTTGIDGGTADHSGRNMRNSDLFYDSLETLGYNRTASANGEAAKAGRCGGSHHTTHKGGATAGEPSPRFDLFYDSLEPEPAAVPRQYSRAWEERKAQGERMRRGDPGVTGHKASDMGTRSSNATLFEPLGLITDADGEPLALDVNPAAFSAAHFATFPPKLVEPLIRAGTSERGCCAACGAPWRRTVERGGLVPDGNRTTCNGDRMPERAANDQGANRYRDGHIPTTTGWAASCQCVVCPHCGDVTQQDVLLAQFTCGVCDRSFVPRSPDTNPCTVLDPFAGAGTTLLVADRLQRDAIGIELSDAYGAMAGARIVDDAPLLAWGAVPELAE
jgi:hypothetical protein